MPDPKRSAAAAKGWQTHQERSRRPVYEQQGMDREEYDRVLGFVAEHPRLVQGLLLRLGVLIEEGQV